MKKTLSLLLATGALITAPVFALDVDVTVPVSPVITEVGATVETKQIFSTSTKLATLKARATALINERIKALEANQTIINNNGSKLTVEQKTTLNTLINTNISGLTLLKANIASSTNAISTKALAESIFSQFRIYGIVIPQIRLEKRIFDLQNHVSKINETFVKVQTRIDEHKAKGHDVTVWQAGLEKAKLLVATDTAKLTALLMATQALKPADYGTSSKATIDSVNKSLKEISKDFKTLTSTIKKPAHLPKVQATATTTVSATTSTSTP